MDLGINGKWAIITGSSEGLGYACAEALIEEGVNIIINGKNYDKLDKAVNLLKAMSSDSEILSVVGDITNDKIQKQIFSLSPSVDILITNLEGPSASNYNEWTDDILFKAINNNTLTQIKLIRKAIDSMVENRFGRILNITSGAIKSPVFEMSLSSLTRWGLTGFVASISKQPEYISNNVTINNILPGAFETQRLKQVMNYMANKKGYDIQQVIEERLANIPAKRFGNPSELGKLCAFLCSKHASYISGQNILIDGGSYKGVF